MIGYYRFITLLLVCASVFSGEPLVHAADRPCVPIKGFSQPDLSAFDAIMVELICAEQISAAVMGMMIDGKIVAQRSYGWVDDERTKALPSDAMMRIASITKPLVAAVVRDLIDDGLLKLENRAFDVDQDGGGILPVQPFPSLSDERVKEITIEHLLLHRGGWDRGEAGDLTYREVQIAQAMDMQCPPGRDATIRYILGQPLQFMPGERDSYSNIGYLALGLIVEHVTGEDLVDEIHKRVLSPIGVQRTELRLGRTFRADSCEREPPYDDGLLAVNVFDPQGPRVPRPYGGWHHEARVGQGGLVTTTETLLKVLDDRVISGPNIGKHRTRDEESGWRRNHTGGLHGLNAIARQRGDGVHYVVIVNKRAAGNPSFVNRLRASFDEALDTMIVTSASQ